MRLTLSGNFLKCTYADENGRIIYKVHSTLARTTISKVIPGDIPRRNSENESDTGDRFAHLGRIDWKAMYSVLVLGGEEFSTRTYFKRDGFTGAMGLNRVFVGDDGREYKWLLGSWTSELRLKNEYKTLVAKLIRGNIGGIFGQKRPAVLEIYPAGEHMVDLIMLTFLYVESVYLADTSLPLDLVHLHINHLYQASTAFMVSSNFRLDPLGQDTVVIRLLYSLSPTSLPAHLRQLCNPSTARTLSARPPGAVSLYLHGQQCPDCPRASYYDSVLGGMTTITLTRQVTRAEETISGLDTWVPEHHAHARSPATQISSAWDDTLAAALTQTRIAMTFFNFGFSAVDGLRSNTMLP
ncbi:hypothetical protein L218DRAFT_997355 [Marasmius fiardii PR-910]|nr:hypothetical protein L218DRAFT_997355 [Marasmius fiardii PR-910]